MVLNKNIDFFIKNVLNLDLNKDVIFIKNSNFEYIYANSKFCDLFNINLKNLIGKKDIDFISDKILLKTCEQSDLYVFENNYLICIESAFDKEFRVLKLKIDLGNNNIGILCFAKTKDD